MPFQKKKGSKQDFPKALVEVFDCYEEIVISRSNKDTLKKINKLVGYPEKGDHMATYYKWFKDPLIKKTTKKLFEQKQEVLKIVLPYLDVRSLCAAELVCKEMKRVISDDELWKKLIKRKVRTDSMWRGLADCQGWIKYLFTPPPGVERQSYSLEQRYYKSLYQNTMNNVELIKNNWLTSNNNLQRIHCQSENSKGVFCLQYDDNKIVAGLENNTIQIWDRDSLKCQKVLTGHTDPVLCLQFDDKVLITGSSDSTVRVWDVETTEMVNILDHHSQSVVDLKFNNGVLVTCSWDFSTAVWDIISPTQINFRQFLMGHQFDISAVYLDDKYIVSGSADLTIKVWNTSTGELVRTLDTHKEKVTCLQNRGKLIVSGSTDRLIRLWDIESGDCLRILEGHDAVVRCIRFDSKRIVSGDDHGKIKVWDLFAALDPRVVKTNRLCLYTLKAHTHPVFHLQFDDCEIVSCSHDGTILISCYWTLAQNIHPSTSHFDCLDVIDTKNLSDSIFTSFACRTIIIGSHVFDPKEKVICTSRGIRIIAPNVRHPAKHVILDIKHGEIAKVLTSFNEQLNVIFLYTNPNCGIYVRESLDMGLESDNLPYYNPACRLEKYKCITLLIENISTESKSIVKSIYTPQILEEIPLPDANELLLSLTPKDVTPFDSAGNNSNASLSLNSQDIRKILIYPQGKGGISINTQDYMCLAIDQHLNDVIIDFYLNYLQLNVLKETQKEKTHVFSTFFYKSLTTVSPQGDSKLTAAQKRYERVKIWTKHVNLFDKDFIYIPIMEKSHWFLAIICYPGLMSPVTSDTGAKVKTPLPIFKKKPPKKQMSLQIGNTTIKPVSKRNQQHIYDSINLNDARIWDESELGLTDAESGASERIKQPCILIFDSLAGSSRSHVVVNLRDYLTCEYKAKVMAHTSHTFNKDNMPDSCVKVPQQKNLNDCGLYLLQYVEEFFSHPIKDFRLPVRSLENWFETIVVIRKREEIADIIQHLHANYNSDERLPNIKFPTLKGKLLEREDEEAEFEAEFEVEELKDTPNDPTYSTENKSSPEKASKSNARGSKNIMTAASTSTTNNENNQSTSNISLATTIKTLFEPTHRYPLRNLQKK